MKGPQTLQQAIQFFSEYENCRMFMIAVRWADGKVRCPYCGAAKVTYLEKARLYRCYGDHPKQKFSLKIGTVFGTARSRWKSGYLPLGYSPLAGMGFPLTRLAALLA